MPLLALQQNLSNAFGSVLSSPINSSNPPQGWNQFVEDNFTRAARFGPDALDPNIWKHRSFGTGSAHQGSSFWNNGLCLESTGTTLRIHAIKEGTVWKVDGFRMGAQDSDPLGYGYHAGFDQFHFEFRARFSHQIAPGVGPYALFWPSDGNWSSEIDIMEMPGRIKDRSMSTIHWDSTGRYNLGLNNEISPVLFSVDMTQWNTWKCRREYFTDTDGILKARVLVWINDTLLVTPGIWRRNQWLTEKMSPGFASFVAPPGAANFFTLPSSETPVDTYLEVDYAYLWAPEITTTKTLGITPSNPGTLIEASTGAGTTWQTTVVSNNIPRISWAVFNGPPTYTQVGSAIDVNTDGRVSIQPRFTTTGQFLKVWEFGNIALFRDSGPATVTTPTQQRTLSISPQNPGSRPAGAWSTVVTSNNITTLTWVVVNPNFSWVTAGQDINTTGSVTINPNFTATGQFLKIFPKNDTTLQVNSGQVTITV